MGCGLNTWACSRAGNGPQEPISISFTDKENPLTRGLTDWTTIREEHYNNVHVFDTAKPIAHGTQVIDPKASSPHTSDSWWYG